MADNVVDIPLKPRLLPDAPMTDVWFAQVDLRLARIEAMISRLEWQVWIILCGVAGLLSLQILKTIAPA